MTSTTPQPSPANNQKPAYELFTKDTTAFFYNLKADAIQRMLDFDYLCQRETPSITAIIQPGKSGFHKVFFGAKEMTIPIYSTIEQATTNHPNTDVLINFASFRSAYESSKQALLSPTINTIIIVAEGIPEIHSRKLIALTNQLNQQNSQNQNHQNQNQQPQNHSTLSQPHRQSPRKTIIGPSTVGGICAGKFRIANCGGTTDNLLRAKLYRPGSIGLVSKSGGITNEMFNILARSTNGIYEGIAIGGDTYPGSTLLDHILRFEQNPNIKLIIALGEIGGQQEYDIINAKQQQKITKPLIMLVPGISAKIFPWQVQFGHAGAKAGNAEESADAKNLALKQAGIIVPESFEDLEPTIKSACNKLVEDKIINLQPETTPSQLPLDYQQALKQNLIRKPTNFTTTISSDIGEEPTYLNLPISQLIENNSSIGDIISLLWFKKQLPKSFTKLIELAIILCADHGPAVSGAHNAIVTARAGKDIISSLCTGLLTIGPRFGGAIDDAARYFKHAHDNNIPPEQFVEQMKQQGLLIPGIGHRVKSKRNPDKRVELLKQYTTTHFKNTPYLTYALKVEKITLEKAENLILNVDGCLAVCFLDALTSSSQFSADEINNIINIGYLNALFALSRSIGLIGHILDQKRLNTELYRHPTDDILYLL